MICDGYASNVRFVDQGQFRCSACEVGYNQLKSLFTPANRAAPSQRDVAKKPSRTSFHIRWDLSQSGGFSIQQPKSNEGLIQSNPIPTALGNHAFKEVSLTPDQIRRVLTVHSRTYGYLMHQLISLSAEIIKM
jgi:hypothetical protein